MPLNNPAQATQITYGIYTGDSSVNRAIPHGLPGVPKIVLILDDSSNFHMMIIRGLAMVKAQTSSIDAEDVVTAMDTTNFYVGHSPNWDQSANYTGYAYKWVAIG